MIPKKIHYCWLSNDPFPPSIQKCIDSWKRVLPDYELVLWNFDRFPKGKSLWVDQAFDNRRYAFAADYIRAYALYNEGGIYLDSDVEVLKPFDDLLHLPYFLGKESTEAGVEAATLGFEAKHPLIKALLDYYDSKPFIGDNGAFDEQPMPFLFRKCIASMYQYHEIKDIEEFSDSDQVINILPVDWFSPKDWRSLQINKTDRTYSIHHFAASWKKDQLTRKAVFKDWLFKTKINIRNHCTSLLLLKRNVCFLTNSSLAFPFSNAFGLPKCSPLSQARMSQLDFISLMKLSNQLESLELQFIKQQESKYKQYLTTFYPIARIKGTEIEIHYCQCVSREEAFAIWTSGVANAGKKQLLWFFVATNPDGTCPEFPGQGFVAKKENNDYDLGKKMNYLLALCKKANGTLW